MSGGVIQDGAPASILVGLVAEARIARRLGWPVGIGGGGVAGARAAAEQLVAEGAKGLVSFGLAGGLDPSLRPGGIIVPARIRIGARTVETDAELSARLGGPTPHCLWAGETIAATRVEKARIWAETRAAAIDLETAAIAEAAAAHGLPFAALRAICDPAERSLPPAALAALNANGAIGLWRVLASLVRSPSQLPGLLALARDAALARRALIEHVEGLTGS